MPATLRRRPTEETTEETKTADDALHRATTTCPRCAEPLVEGQGLVACTDCRWTGVYE